MIAHKIRDVLGHLSGRLQIVHELELSEEDVTFIREMKYYTYSATKDAFSASGRSVDTR